MRKAILTLAAASALAISTSVRAAVTVDGSLDADYGSALTTQTVNTGFGDSTVGDGSSSGGSELDAAYGTIEGGNLYLLLSGNVEDSNHVNIFISDGRAGQSTLALPATGSMSAMNGSNFSPGFQATYAIDINNYTGTSYVEEYNLTGTPSGGYLGSFPTNSGTAGNPGGSINYSFNNTNAAGVNGNTGTAADPVAADAVSTGLELSIPLSLLGNPTSPIMILADINGGSDNYLSNQFLPGLPVGSGNLGNNGVFDFSATPGQYFTVTPVPEPASLGLLAGAMTLLAARRRST